LYAGRTKGKSKQDGRFEKFGIKKEDEKHKNESTQIDNEDPNEVSDKSSKRAWARLIQKVYEVDPLICPECGSEMKIVAIIQDRVEIQKIITHHEKKNRPVLNEAERSPPLIEKFL
jgi:hypothetical protein